MIRDHERKAKNLGKLAAKEVLLLAPKVLMGMDAWQLSVLPRAKPTGLRTADKTSRLLILSLRSSAES